MIEAIISFIMGWPLVVFAASVVLSILILNGPCFHLYEVGGGIFGDAWLCKKCGRDRYEEHTPFKWFYRLIGRAKE